jgi:Fungal protein kinase
MCEGLRWLFRAGYVHRDISAGNVLCVNGSGRLSDLEFCKNYKTTPRSTEHEMKTVSFLLLNVCVSLIHPAGNQRVYGLGDLKRVVLLLRK